MFVFKFGFYIHRSSIYINRSTTVVVYRKQIFQKFKKVGHTIENKKQILKLKKKRIQQFNKHTR